MVAKGPCQVNVNICCIQAFQQTTDETSLQWVLPLDRHQTNSHFSGLLLMNIKICGCLNSGACFTKVICEQTRRLQKWWHLQGSQMIVLHQFLGTFAPHGSCKRMHGSFAQYISCCKLQLSCCTKYIYYGNHIFCSAMLCSILLLETNFWTGQLLLTLPPLSRNIFLIQLY